MSGAMLQPCESCGSHIHAGSEACPFCKAVQSKRSRRRRPGPLAALGVSVVAVAANLAISACAYGCPPRTLPDGGIEGCGDYEPTDAGNVTDAGVLPDGGALPDGG